MLVEAVMFESTNQENAGINREKAGSLIIKFLENKDYRVLAVKGKWGVGKTHLVQTFLDKQTEGNCLYASVFGISSIEQLKARLIVNYKSQENQETKNFIYKIISNGVEWVSRNTSRLEKNSKLNFRGIPGSLFAVAGDLGLEMLFHINIVKNSIICIDDLERKSKLSLEDILGFVEYLVQECKCKIILIYNEENLAEECKKTLDRYREKVIDREFKLDPKVEENLDFVFKDNPDIEVIKTVFKNAGTNNIRVIRKTQSLINELIPLMENWEVSLRHQIIRNSIVIILSKLDTEFSKKNPNIKDIKSTLSIDPSEYMGTDKKANDIAKLQLGQDKIKALQEMQLLSLEFGYIDLEELDELIIQLVETSLDKDAELRFSELGNIFNQRERKSQILKKLDELSNNSYKSKYYNSFADNEQDIIDGIITFLKENYLQLSISEFEKIEQFTSIFGLDISKYEKPLLEIILAEIFEQNFNLSENLSTLDLSSFRNKLSKYPDLDASLNKKIKEYHQTLDIPTVVKNIIDNNSSSRSFRLQQDIDFLRSLTVDEYCQWLKKDNPDMVRMVRWILDCGYQPAPENLEQAIRILAECSKINKIRARFLYSIDIDEPAKY